MSGSSVTDEEQTTCYPRNVSGKRTDEFQFLELERKDGGGGLWDS